MLCVRSLVQRPVRAPGAEAEAATATNAELFI